MSDWIDIKKQKPEPFSSFIGFVPAYFGNEVCSCFEDQGKYVIGFSSNVVDITHWMPNPSPPKNNKNQRSDNETN